jgi:hypothetical protein
MQVAEKAFNFKVVASSYNVLVRWLKPDGYSPFLNFDFLLSNFYLEFPFRFI